LGLNELLCNKHWRKKMSKIKVLFVIVVASLIALVIGGGSHTVGTARVLPTSKGSVQQGKTVPYSGMLTDHSGNLIADGSYDFTFALYAAETTGEPLWAEVQESIMVMDGGFLTSLGSINPIPASTSEGSRTLWLAIGLRGPGEAKFTMLVPRQRLSTFSQTTQASSAAGASCPHDHFGEYWIGTGKGLGVKTDLGVGVEGWSDSNIGVAGISALSAIPWTPGHQYGVFGYSDSDHGVYGKTNGEWSWISGVYGEASKDGANGVTGWNTAGGVGVYGHSETGVAGYFDGDVDIIGNLYKSSGSFKIDHPLDPANKYLYHSFVESPDMKNIYDGVIILDAGGTAWVELPEWFEALNKDFRYQLTPIGAPAPDLYIAEEIDSNRFMIAGGGPGLNVSWQVTGSRQDAYAEAHPLQVEEAKPLEELGTYLHPEEHGMPRTEGLNYQMYQPPEQIETGGE
jgi:hypothetical protein